MIIILQRRALWDSNLKGPGLKSGAVNHFATRLKIENINIKKYNY